MKLVPFILIVDGTPKQHKRMPQKDFLSKFEKIRQVLKHTLHSNKHFDKIFGPSILSRVHNREESV